jgi:hypothetical protein
LPGWNVTLQRWKSPSFKGGEDVKTANSTQITHLSLLRIIDIDKACFGQRVQHIVHVELQFA